MTGPERVTGESEPRLRTWGTRTGTEAIRPRSSLENFMSGSNGVTCNGSPKGKVSLVFDSESDQPKEGPG